jgi:hypothetical protein
MKTFYGGEKNKFDWSKYVSIHKRCYNDLEATGPALSEDDKVRRLLHGIHTQKLDTAVLFVRSSPNLMSNFDAAVDSITTVVENMRESFKRPFQQVSSVETDPLTGLTTVNGDEGGTIEAAVAVEATVLAVDADVVVLNAQANHGLNLSLPVGISNMNLPECLDRNDKKCGHAALNVTRSRKILGNRLLLPLPLSLYKDITCHHTPIRRVWCIFCHCRRHQCQRPPCK